MLDNQTSAVHGQIFISALIETMLEQVDIPLTLQEIEGDAEFHTIAPRPQVSGIDVILAHRLLKKNSIPSHEYLLLTEAAYAAMSPYLPGTFDAHQEG